MNPNDVELIRQVLDGEVSRKEAIRTFETRQLAMLGVVVLHAGNQQIFTREKHTVRYGEMLHEIVVGDLDLFDPNYRSSDNLVVAARKLKLHSGSREGGRVTLQPLPRNLSKLLENPSRYARAELWRDEAHRNIRDRREARRRRKDRKCKLGGKLRRLYEENSFEIEYPQHASATRLRAFHEQALALLDEYGE